MEEKAVPEINGPFRALPRLADRGARIVKNRRARFVDTSPSSFPGPVRNVHIFEEIGRIYLSEPVQGSEFFQVVCDTGPNCVKVFPLATYGVERGESPLDEALAVQADNYSLVPTLPFRQYIGRHRENGHVIEVLQERGDEACFAPYIVIYAYTQRIVRFTETGITAPGKAQVFGIPYQPHIWKPFHYQLTTAVGAAVVNDDNFIFSAPLFKGSKNRRKILSQEPFTIVIRHHYAYCSAICHNIPGLIKHFRYQAIIDSRNLRAAIH